MMRLAPRPLIMINGCLVFASASTDTELTDLHLLPDSHAVAAYRSERKLSKIYIETYLSPPLWALVGSYLDAEKPLLILLMTPTWMHSTIVNGLGFPEMKYLLSIGDVKLVERYIQQNDKHLPLRPIPPHVSQAIGQEEEDDEGPLEAYSDTELTANLDDYMRACMGGPQWGSLDLLLGTHLLTFLNREMLTSIVSNLDAASFVRLQNLVASRLKVTVIDVNFNMIDFDALAAYIGFEPEKLLTEQKWRPQRTDYTLELLRLNKYSLLAQAIEHDSPISENIGVKLRQSLDLGLQEIPRSYLEVLKALAAKKIGTACMFGGGSALGNKLSHETHMIYGVDIKTCECQKIRPCERIITRGKREGQVCGQNAVEGTNRCRNHMTDTTGVTNNMFPLPMLQPVDAHGATGPM